VSLTLNSNIVRGELKNVLKNKNLIKKAGF